MNIYIYIYIYIYMLRRAGGRQEESDHGGLHSREEFRGGWMT